MKYFFVFCFLFLNVFIAFGQSGGKQIPYLKKLDSIKEFESLQGEPFNFKYGSVQSLKVTYEIKDQQLYFISSHRYTFHYQFCNKELNFWKNQYFFNAYNYSESEHRQYYLANINYYDSQDLFTLEFSAVDEISMEQICELYESVSQNSFIGGKLKVLINSNHIEKVFENSNYVLPLITSNELYEGLTYQPLNEGASIGYLKRVAIDTIENTHLNPKDIVIINGTPNDLELTAGVICQDFQTPLSHITILCQNRRIPVMAFKNIWEDAQVSELEGELVYFQVKKDEYLLRKVSLKEAEEFWEQKQKTKKKIKLASKRDYKELMPLEKMSYYSHKTIGSKAANFGELAKIVHNKEKLNVPEGAFAIPFYYYFEHISESGALAKIEELANGNYPDFEEYNVVLEEIREAIKCTEVNPELLEMVEAKIKEVGQGNRMRFRSSTNAEDLASFNGAGLYDSKTGIIGDSIKTIEKAIQRVWASTWSLRAFQERSYFGIPQNEVAMGILVHRSFPDEYANGVAISKNLYRKNYYGTVINVQLGEVSVVNSPEGIVCDQLLCYEGSDVDFFDEKNTIEYITLSNISNGESVLTEAEVLELTAVIVAIKKHFFNIYHPSDPPYGPRFFNFGLDIEFKFDKPNRELYVKQVRPF